MWDLRFYRHKKNDAVLMDKFARLSTPEAGRGLDFSKTYATKEGCLKKNCGAETGLPRRSCGDRGPASLAYANYAVAVSAVPQRRLVGDAGLEPATR
jgi:hypothetical protein